jgi:SPP1 gp7 family putative phage head morphogenesis protein
MAKKPKINKDISEASKALKEIMSEELAKIGNDLISQVMRQAKQLTPSQRLKAISGLSPKGVRAYTDLIKTALSTIALESLEKVKKEIPKKKNVALVENLNSIQLDEFDRLPAKLRKKIQAQTQLLIGKQIGDIQKVIEFAYTTAEDETDSLEQIEADLNESAIGWIDGTAIESGAALNASTVINSARNAFFFDDEVLEEVDAFQFVNGDPVTQICNDLAGTIFSKDDPAADRYFPPLHFNCKSYIVPILKGNLGSREIEKLKPSKKSLEQQVQFSEHDCGEFHHV